MSRGLALIAGVVAALLAAGLATARDRGTTQQAAPAGAGEPVFVIHGRGWGHGVGMSQWGAHGLARRGADYRRILTHYYRGTTIGRAPVAKIRVLLDSGKSSLTVESAAPFRVRDAAGGVRALVAGKHVFGPRLKLKTKGAKKPAALEGPIVFLPGDEPLRLGRRYRGTIQVDVVAGRLRAVNVVGLEQYLYGVVPAEVPDYWPAEVLKAQAVAARSYALATRKTGGAFDVYPDVRSQVYRGVDEEEDSTNAAVDETAAEILTYGGKVVTTYFHSTSGGRTASVVDVWPGSKPTPYLVAVDDPYDAISPHHTWGPVSVPAARLRRALKVPGRLLDVKTVVNSSSRVDRVVGVGTGGQGAARGGDLRRDLGLRSSWFKVGVLALPTPARPHVFGGTTRLTGIARGLDRIALEQRVGTGWRGVATPRPAQDGTFAVAVRPTSSAEYRLASGSVRTPSVRLGVAPQVRLNPVTDPMELRGTVRPALVGAAVEVQRLAGNTWRTVGRSTVVEGGTFAATTHVPPGTYRAYVRAPGRGLVPGASAPLVVAG